MQSKTQNLENHEKLVKRLEELLRKAQKDLHVSDLKEAGAAAHEIEYAKDNL